jgi:hypothetical protein
MGSGYSWHPEATERAVKDWAIKSLEAACIVVENKAKQLVSIAGTGTRIKTTTGRSGRRLRRKVRTYGTNPTPGWATGRPPFFEVLFPWRSP